jgi:hypothetical protein
LPSSIAFLPSSVKLLDPGCWDTPPVSRWKEEEWNDLRVPPGADVAGRARRARGRAVERRSVLRRTEVVCSMVQNVLLLGDEARCWEERKPAGASFEERHAASLAHLAQIRKFKFDFLASVAE